MNRFLNEAIKNKDTIEFQHIKVFLSGSAAAGKTNLRHSLLGQDFVEKYESTPVQETQHAYVTNNASILESEEGDKIWSEFDLEKQFNYFKSLWKRRLQQKSKNIPAEQIEIDMSYKDNKNKDEKDLLSPEIKEKINESQVLPKEIKIQEPIKMISVIDTGGQPGYIHMLPAIIHMLPAVENCPTVNLIVIDMTKSLEDNVLVHYRKKGQKEEIKPYHLHYTNKDLIQLLLSVNTDSFNIQLQATPSQETVTPKPGVHIGFVGTHKDVLDEEKDTEKIRTLDDQLCALVDKQISDCKPVFIKAKRSQQKYLYPLSNKVRNDENNTLSKIRKEIGNLLDNVKPVMHLPITWMILELAVKLYCDSEKIQYIEYQKFLEIAEDKASIEKEEAKKALYYFHSRGVLLHFEEIPKMRDYVIVEHQWLYTQLSDLVAVLCENPSCGDDFPHGILQNNELLETEEEESLAIDRKIMESLISLLDHKKILASYTKNDTKHYFLPFVLPCCQQYADNAKFLLLEPLLIRLSSGYLPRGFFCSLVVHFLQKMPPGWESLHNKKDFQNVMTFLLPKNNLYLRLLDKIYYLEVQVRHCQHSNGECMVNELKILCKYLYEVCKTLEFDYRKLQFGFLCQHPVWDEEGHMVVLPEPLLCNSKCCRQGCQSQSVVLPLINDLNLVYCEQCQSRAFCEKCKKYSTTVGELHKLWFKEVKVSNSFMYVYIHVIAKNC